MATTCKLCSRAIAVASVIYTKPPFQACTCLKPDSWCNQCVEQCARNNAHAITCTGCGRASVFERRTGIIRTVAEWPLHTALYRFPGSPCFWRGCPFWTWAVWILLVTVVFPLITILLVTCVRTVHIMSNFNSELIDAASVVVFGDVIRNHTAHCTESGHAKAGIVVSGLFVCGLGWVVGSLAYVVASCQWRINSVWTTRELVIPAR